MHWIARIEAEYDQPIHELLQSCRDQAAHTGTSLPMLAEEFGVQRKQLAYLCLKLGIHWPRGVSARHKEKVSELAIANGKRQAKYHAVIDGQRDTVTNHAKRMGINPTTAIWRIKNWQCTPEEALLVPLVGHRERGDRGMQVRYRRSA